MLLILLIYTSGVGGGEIAQWIAYLSFKLAVHVRAQHDLLVSERRQFYQGAIELFPTVLPTGSTKAIPYVIMSM